MAGNRAAFEGTASVKLTSNVVWGCCGNDRVIVIVTRPRAAIFEWRTQHSL